ncbi:uncharacterized protein LOC143215533 isoform X1 [Lasioglossum baleicum]|uniref:uncharacterized protein LOC143215533 isoform X1 n=1 Tax=Lasioglossum baleicum TaxID=434251 RepID=UPI003FCCD196
MERTANKNYMYNLELESLRYWYKRAPSQNQSFKYNNVMQIMRDTVYKNDIVDIGSRESTKLCSNFRNRVILRNVFEHWKMYIVHKLHTRRDVYKADYFYHKKLQKKVLSALSKNVLLKWKNIVSSTYNCTNKSTISRSNCKKTETHHSKTMLLEKAIAFYNLRCLKKCVVCWKMYVNNQHEKKLIQDKTDKAREFYRKKMLKVCITAWLRISEFAFERRENAALYYNNKLLEKYFTNWRMFHALKIKKSLVNKRAQVHSERKLMKQYFVHFIMCVKESIANRTVQEKVEIFYNTKCLEKTFYAWQNWYHEKVKRAIKMNNVKQIFDNRKKCVTFQNWRVYMYEKKCNRRKLFSSENFHKKRLMTKGLRSLYNYTIYRKEKRARLSYLNDKSAAIINNSQRFYIEKWRKALYIIVQEKQKLSQATEFWGVNLSRKYFSYWKEFSQQHKMKQLRKKKLNELASNFLLKRCVLHWRDELQNVLEINRKEIFVKSVINRRILGRHLSLWREYVFRKIAKRKDIEAAKEVYKKFLLREGLKEILKNTLYNIDQRNCLQLEHAAMRSFKNFEILKEYFDKWQSVIYLKNNSKSLRKDSHFIHAETPCNAYDNIKNAGLVVPEYMKEKDASFIANDVMLSLEKWSFDFQ